jgi:MFS family permease
MAVGNLYLIAAVSIIGGGLFGFDISSMSAIIGTKQYKCYFDQSGNGSCIGPKASVQGGITASMAGGSWLGALISGVLSDRLGRKKAIMTGAVIWYSHTNIQDFPTQSLTSNLGVSAALLFVPRKILQCSS